MTTIDEVTGARTEVSLHVGLPRRRLWELVTDVARYGEWSPECELTEWLERAAEGAPHAGDRFSGCNRFGNGFVATTFCVVTEVIRPETFEWVVLDPTGEPDRPGSIWRYELGAGDRPGWTHLRHVFEHGPGDTGARTMAEQSPTGLADRLTQVRANMAASLSAMLDGVPISRCDGSEVV